MTADPAASRAPAGEAGFRLLVEHLPDLILLAFDPQLEIWAATGAALRARGWTPGNFVGKPVPDVGRPDHAAITETHCRAARRGECRRLVTVGRLDPSRVWTLNFVPLPDERGAVIGGLVIARDITEQRQLLASRRQLAEAQRIAQVGSWEWELDGDEATISDEMARILGLPPGSRLQMQDPAPFTLEHRIVRSDGAVRSVLVRGEGVVDEDGRVVRLIGTDQDITDRRRVDAERRRLLGRVDEAQEGQDRRPPADLHDGHVQSLAAIGFRLEQARLRLGASGSPEVDELLWQVTKDLSAEVTSLRRTIGRLRPLVLVDVAHFGLIAMRERVEALGGRFRVTTGPGKGTAVEARLPLTDPSEGSGA